MTESTCARDSYVRVSIEGMQQEVKRESAPVEPRRRRCHLEPAGPVSGILRSGDLVIAPEGCWHRNDAVNEVRMLFITPTTGNDHSWDDPRTK